MDDYTDFRILLDDPATRPGLRCDHYASALTDYTCRTRIFAPPTRRTLAQLRMRLGARTSVQHLWLMEAHRAGFVDAKGCAAMGYRVSDRWPVRSSPS